ncbi:DMT family transporter [Affinibrenneria salicis]|uniref:DMT family transporter n=1 Tax=Affinibrenneria salicis TaxID=2590031 RepID=A0A5J5G1Z6_9GAMM|nr:DMT family transporter [Affinibrenneria salicis]KAA9000776.1 DMT family transporter [Affinibrenneria salicis]
MTSQRKADVCLVLTTLIAACGWIFSREAVAGMPVMAFLGLRFLIASLTLLILCRRGDLPLLLRYWPAVLISGGWLGFNMLLWIYAVAITASLGEGAFIMSLSMLFVPLAAWGMLRISPARAFWFSLPLAVAGLALLTLRNGLTWEVSQLLFLAAAIVQAIYFCYTSRYARMVPPLPLASVQLGCTGLAAILLSVFIESWPQQVNGAIWGWVLASAFIATGLRFWLQLKGQSMTSAANAALIMILEPLFTVVAAAIWYGERMSAQQIVGCLLILTALFYYRWRINK